MKLTEKYNAREITVAMNRLLKVAMEYPKNTELSLASISARISMEAGIVEDCLDTLVETGIYAKVRPNVYTVPE